MISEKSPRHRHHALPSWRSWRLGGSILFVLLVVNLAPTARAQNMQPTTRSLLRQDGSSATRPTGPNFLFLLVDNLAPGLTGFEGNTIVKTPHLDRLAAEGAYFRRCYTPTPQSAPARATVLTGRYPHSHGVIADGRTLGRDADTFSARLKKAGYACGFVGVPGVREDADRPEFGLTDSAPARKSNDAANDDLITGQVTQVAEFLEKHKSQSFFLWVSLPFPREPLVNPPGGRGQIAPETLPLPKTMQVNKNGWPAKLKNALASTRFDQKKSDEPSIRQDRAKYCAMVAHLDEAAGQILERLEKLDLDQNTVAVLAACHGFAIGDHGLYGTGPAFFEEIVRSPLLIRWPGTVQAGTKIDRVVGLVDLAPTFLTIAGLNKPFTMQGVSLVPLLKNPRLIDHDDQRFFEFDRQHADLGAAGPDASCTVRGVVTRNYKFIDYPEDPGNPDNMFVFYDLKRDPDEMDNLKAHMDADETYKLNYNAVLGVLLNGLGDWRKRTHDGTGQ